MQTFGSQRWTAGDQLPVIGFSWPGDGTGFTVTMEIQRPGVAPSIAPDVLQIVGVITQANPLLGYFPFGATDLQAGNGQICDVLFVNASNQPQHSKRYLINVDPLLVPIT